MTDATDEKEDIEDGEESVDKGAPSPVPVSRGKITENK